MRTFFGIVRAKNSLGGHPARDPKQALRADMTGLDMTKVKVYLFRARKALQERIGDPAMVA